MDTSDAFLEAICLEPDDDGLRLIYADWLEERGEPRRAKFIRVQCELAGLPPCADECRNRIDHECRGCTLRRRERELSYDHWADWTQSLSSATGLIPCHHDPRNRLAGGHMGVEFRRGFVESVTLTCAAFAGGPCGRCEGGRAGWREGTAFVGGPCPDCRGTGHTEGVAGALFRAAPVREVVLSDRRPWIVLPEDGQVCWFLERTGRVDGSQSSLPAVLWNLIDARGQHWYDDQVKVFNDEDHHTAADLARDALSAACVAFGRQAAGLPALTPAPAAVP